MEKSPEAFRTISEVATELDVPQHVLRFWESKFSQVRPMKRGGGRRYYRPQDIELLKGIRHLLYGEGYTIRGVQKILKENGVAKVIGSVHGAPLASDTPDTAASVPISEAAPVAVDEATLNAVQSASGLSREQVQVLQATLYELSEIKRIVDDCKE